MSHRRRLWVRWSLSVVCLALVCVTAGPSRGAEGRIPIYQPIVLDGSGGPISGKYVVTRKIEPVGPSALMIRIIGTGSEEIEIDLNGFTVGGSAGGSAEYTFSATNLAKLTVRNGTLVSDFGEPGCMMVTAGSGKTSLILEDLRMTCGNSGLTASDWDDVRIRRNSINADGGTIAVSGTLFKGAIEDNLLNGGGQQGSASGIAVTASSSGLVIRGNRIRASGGGGIDVDNAVGLLLEANAVSGGAGSGIRLDSSTACHVRKNSVTNSLGSGFIFSSTSDCLIVDNVARGNDASGIELWDSDRNHVERNVANGNGGEFVGYGIRFDSRSEDNTYGRNTATRNSGPAEQCPQSPDPLCGSPQLCDQGRGNKSFGDNLVPGPPPC